jgi:hypothetical protein
MQPPFLLALHTDEQQEASDEAKRRRKLMKAIQSGHATADQWAEYHNQQSQDQWSARSGSEIGGDIRDLRGQVSGARSAVGSGQGDARALEEYHNEDLGLIRDVHASATQRISLEELRRQVENLQYQIAMNRPGS